MKTLDRFLNYVSVDTTSDSYSKKFPSTKNQKKLAKMIFNELYNIGADYFYDGMYGYVYAKVSGDQNLPSIGFIAHLDTSEDAPGKNITPIIHEKYSGNDIELNNNIVLSTESYPDLLNHIGKTLITSNGTTLLGADDKAGITEIMNMLKYYSKSNEIHGDIYACFTPDEEIGKGLDYFEKMLFDVDFAFTVDGNAAGEISYENFNAAKATININGVSTHCGYAKGKMINSLLIANEINSLLPNQTPANTEKYEGFYHLNDMCGNISQTTLHYLIRDFDDKMFELRKKNMESIVSFLNQKYNSCVSIEIKDQYYNMRKIIEKEEYQPYLESLVNATKQADLTCQIVPIRGGTDGCALSFNGIPCLNIGTGGHNFHSIYEYVCLEDMDKVSNVLINTVKNISTLKRVRKR